MKKSDCIYSFVNTLNYINSKDKEALKKVLLTKEETKINIEEDPVVIGNEPNKLSALGVLNTLLNSFCDERISAVLDDNGDIIRFEVYKKWNTIAQA